MQGSGQQQHHLVFRFEGAILTRMDNDTEKNMETGPHLGVLPFEDKLNLDRLRFGGE